MSMKKIRPAAAIFAVCIALTGCAGNSSSDESTAAEETSEITEEASETEAADPQDAIHAALLERSALSMGNNYRLKKQIEKLKNNEKVTIAYIGGSITEGSGGTYETCYAKKSFNNITEHFKNTNSEYVNAGISGTPSVLGNIRLRRDVLDKNADIVFIEFAVNDAQDNLHKESYESMIRTILGNDPETAVVLLFNRLEGGYSCQNIMAQTGEYYSLPMISPNDAITPELDEGRMTWKDYSNDYAHPNITGHALVAEMIENFFILTDEAASDEAVDIPEIPLNGKDYENMTLVTPENISEEQNLKITDMGGFKEDSATVYKGVTEISYKNDGSGKPMKISVNANSFFVIYKRNKTDMGKAEVYINGKKLKTIDALHEDGWGDPYSVQIIKFQSPKDMEIEIKMADDSLEKDFEIAGFGYSVNDTAVKY